MTIKNTKKNISAEPGHLVVDVNILTPTVNNDLNFSDNQRIEVIKEDFLDEEDNKQEKDYLPIPLKELVRLQHLQDRYYSKVQSDERYYTKVQCDERYYTKTYIDAHVRLRYEVVQTVPTAASVRQAGKTNYIYLVAFNPDSEAGNNEEQYQEGHFVEYLYVADDDEGTNERMERIGSTKIDLTPYLKKADFNTTLKNDTDFKYVKNLAETNEANIPKKVDIKQDVKDGILVTDATTGNVKVVQTISKQKINDFSHLHGRINNNGELTNGGNSLDKDKILVSNSNGLIIGKDTLFSDKILNSSALTGISSDLSSNSSLSNILAKTNSKFLAIDQEIETLNGNLSDYELKANLKNDVWGTTGFTAAQELEEDYSLRTMKTGEYVYEVLTNRYYTATEINDFIGYTRALQETTLELL